MPDTAATGCDSLSIARPGAIQPFAALVAVDRDWHVRAASANLAPLLGLAGPALPGTPLSRLLPPASLHRLRGAAPRSDTRSDTPPEVARLFGLRLGQTRRADVALHALPDGWVIEAEPARRAAAPLLGLVHRLADRARARPDLPALLDEAVRGLAALTGFDRVLAYRFEADASGRVVAESDAAGPPRFLGLRFPASDIPAQARALYARNLLRVIADTEAAPVPLVPAAAAPDLSMSMSRAVAQVHLDYLRAMGVRASMSVSLPGDQPGSLWGLLACHHGQPHAPDYATRSAVELYGQILGHEIAARRRAADRDAAEALEQAVRTAGPAGSRAAHLLPVVRARLGCDGVALVEARSASTGPAVDGAGLLPGIAILRALAARAGTAPGETRAAQLPGWGQADLAVALPVTGQSALVLVRRRPDTADLWAGNPAEALTAGPARSFAIWRAGGNAPAPSLDAGEQALARGLAAQLAAAQPRADDGPPRPVVPDTVPAAPDPTAPNLTPDARIARATLDADEARHRARHVFQLAAALARSTLPPAEADRMARALADLARTSAAAPADPRPVRLSQLIAAELAPWRPGLAGCGPLRGDDPLLPPALVLPLTIAIHELAANAARHGALARRGGSLHLRLRRSRRSGIAHLLWVERGGPVPRTDARPGTGRAIVARALATLPGGHVRVRLGAAGLAARLSFDLPPEPGTAQARASLLVVEDDPLVATDLSRMLADLGHGPVTIARTLPEATAMLRTASPAAVLCDLTLAGDSGLPVVTQARDAGLPVIVVSGADPVAGASRDPGLVMLTKPVSPANLARALASVLATPPPDAGPGPVSRADTRPLED